MRHAHDDVLDALVSGGVDDLLHAHHKHLASLQPEALRRRVFLGEEGFEVVRPAQPVEHADLLLLGELDLVGRLNLLADPVDLLVVPDVHVLDAHVGRIHLVQPRDHVAQLHVARADEPRLQQAIKVDLAVHVGLGEAVVGELEVGRRRAVEVGIVDAKRIQVGHIVPARLIRVNQVEHLCLQHVATSTGELRLGLLAPQPSAAWRRR